MGICSGNSVAGARHALQELFQACRLEEALPDASLVPLDSASGRTRFEKPGLSHRFGMASMHYRNSLFREELSYVLPSSPALLFPDIRLVLLSLLTNRRVGFSCFDVS